MVRAIKLHKSWRYGRSFLVVVTAAIIAVGCGIAEGPSSVNTSSNLDKKTEALGTSQSSEEKGASKRTTHQDVEAQAPKVIDIGSDPSFFKGDISELAAALGDGPYKIGKPVNGYASDLIKEVFDSYDFESVYREYRNKDVAVCDFARVVLFSDEVDFSQFYWHHPDAGNEPLEKFDTHTYLLNDGLDTLIYFDYIQYGIGRELGLNNVVKRDINKLFKVPTVNMCDVGLNPVWEDIEPHMNSLRYNRPSVSNIGGCKSEYAGGHYSDGNYFERGVGSLYREAAPGSTIGFFIYQDSLYIVSLRLFKHYVKVVGKHGRGTIITVDKEIKVAKVTRKNGAIFSEIKVVCGYTPDFQKL